MGRVKTMRRISVEERRARLGRRHHLAPAARSTSVEEVAGDLVGLHSTGAAAVYLSAWARMRSVSIPDVERALYDDRTIVRILGMRRTVFVVPLDLAPVIEAACTRKIAAWMRRQSTQLIEAGGIAKDGGRWLRRAESAAHRALLARGEATASELGEDVPALRARIRFGEGKRWAAEQSMSTRVLWQLAADGLAIRGRPRGGWNSTQYRWAPVEAWLPRGMPRLPVDETRVELAQRWLRSFGPATIGDLRWWTGWTLGDTKQAVAALDVDEVDLDGQPGIVLAGDVGATRAVRPWAALLPALDPTIMGWKGRDWYLGDHGPALFDRAGNAGPSVWVNGRVVGGWGQRKDGEVVFKLLEDVGRDGAALVEAEVERLTSWLGGQRVVPLFRTPLERTLVE
jgi:DNA glycosylase AlkZ-like